VEAPAPAAHAAPHSAKAAPLPVALLPPTDSLSGTITFHNDNWKADFLANPVAIASATLHLDGHTTLWDPIEFSYGALKGTAVLTMSNNCDTPAACAANLDLTFGDLDAATVQTSILGAREKGTLLSDLLNRLHPSAAPLWPRVKGTVKADSLILGPVTLKGVRAAIDMQPAATQITSLDATLLGGSLHASGQFETGDKPYYELTGDLTKLDPAAVGKLLGQTWHGGVFAASGKIQLSGFTASDLAASAKGTLHFDWHHGAISAPATVPALLSHFDLWSADATIASGKISLDQNDRNQAVQGSHKHSVDASVTLSDPAKITFAAPKASPTVDPAKKP
jgi:hypothetical protein